jgi:hypothetical protein
MFFSITFTYGGGSLKVKLGTLVQLGFENTPIHILHQNEKNITIHMLDYDSK